MLFSGQFHLCWHTRVFQYPPSYNQLAHPLGLPRTEHRTRQTMPNYAEHSNPPLKDKRNQQIDLIFNWYFIMWSKTRSLNFVAVLTYYLLKSTVRWEFEYSGIAVAISYKYVPGFLRYCNISGLAKMFFIRPWFEGNAQNQIWSVCFSGWKLFKRIFFL